MAQANRLSILALLGVGTLVGALYEQAERHQARAEYPAPGGARALAAFAWTGLARLLIPVDTSSVPAAVGRAAAAYAPTSLGPMLEESAGMVETMTDAGSFRTLGDRPLVVLTATMPMDSAVLATVGLSPEQGKKLQAEWLKMHNEEATWSSASEHQALPDASHYIQRDRPDVVIAAVRRVVERLRMPVDSTGRP